jgi:hypothetical protein
VRVGENKEFGLFMRGYIQGRTRRLFEASGKIRFCYIFLVNGVKYLIYSWDSENILPVGIDIEVPVAVSTYSDKNNQLHMQITILGEKNKAGEEAF